MLARPGRPKVTAADDPGRPGEPKATAADDPGRARWWDKAGMGRAVGPQVAGGGIVPIPTLPGLTRALDLACSGRGRLIRRTGTEILQLMAAGGTLTSGVNWLSPGWQPSPTATLTGTAAIITSTSNDPQLDPAFAPLPTSPCRDSAPSLLAAYQFSPTSASVVTASAHARLPIAAPDLGAIESGLAAPAPATAFSLHLAPTGPVLRLTGTPNAPYAAEFSADLITWLPLATTLASPTGLAEIPDPSALGQPRRFYREPR